MKGNEYGIGGLKAPELLAFPWIDANGKEMDKPVQLADYPGKFIILYCFQSWCPGCHSIGLPSLKKMVKALEKNDAVKFFAIQTVFEGKSENNFEKLKETQQQYQIPVPFGQDEGDNSTHNISSTMYHYRTGGTPWFIFIDKNGNVVFNDYHLDTEKAIEYLLTVN